MSGVQPPTPTLPSCIPFPIAKEQLLDVVDKAKDWALMHGAGMRSKAAFNPNIMQVQKSSHTLEYSPSDDAAACVRV